MKNSTAISVVMMIGMFIACSDDFGPLGGDCVRLSVEVPCADAEIQTRTSITGSRASFTNGDVVGVFETLTGKNNVAFCTTAVCGVHLLLFIGITEPPYILFMLIIPIIPPVRE